MKSILLKLSGEALSGDKGFGFDEDTVKNVASQVKGAMDTGIRLGVVIGGGNFWRGRSSSSIERTKADQIGMLATVMNCIYVSEIFRSEGIRTDILTPFECADFSNLYSKDRLMEDLDEGKAVFFAGGTGHPYFSTDTATVLRAIEMEASCIYLAKAVDGVYDKDPKTYKDAIKYDEISIEKVVEEKLGVIDLAASALLSEHKIPMYVFALKGENSIINSMTGKFTGTKITV